jgi:hypothetical protein
MSHEPTRCFGPYRLAGLQGPLWQGTIVGCGCTDVSGGVRCWVWAAFL